MTNPNLVRTSRLSLIADEGAPNARTIDLSSRLVVDNPSPGAIITDGVGSDRGPRFRPTGEPRSRSRATSSDSTSRLRADQVAAIKAFALKVKLAK